MSDQTRRQFLLSASTAALCASVPFAAQSKAPVTLGIDLSNPIERAYYAAVLFELYGGKEIWTFRNALTPPDSGVEGCAAS